MGQWVQQRRDGDRRVRWRQTQRSRRDQKIDGGREAGNNVLAIVFVVVKRVVGTPLDDETTVLGRGWPSWEARAATQVIAVSGMGKAVQRWRETREPEDKESKW